MAKRKKGKTKAQLLADFVV